MKEFRVCEVRGTDPAGDSGLILEGVPVVFDKPTTIKESFGQYTEVIKRGALDGADLSDVRLLYNHDLGKLPLARTPKTMRFNLEPAGLRMTAELPETPEGQGVYMAVKRGDLSGMSFAFKVPKEGSSFDPKTNTRTITKISKLYEVSICPFPAYPQTSVEARSAMEQAKQNSQEVKKAKIKINQILRRVF